MRYIHLLSFSLLILLQGWLCPVAAQNLVPNPGFEVKQHCPNQLNQVKVAKDWRGNSNFPPDYFHSCAQGKVSTPNNQYGYQKPHTGNGYIGLAITRLKVIHRQYASVELKYPLQKNQLYQVTFYASLADQSGHTSDGLGVYLGSRRPGTFRDMIPQIYQKKGEMLSDTGQWMKITRTIVARGHERYLTIGNFYPYNFTTKTPLHEHSDTLAYYYIDDVSVTPLQQSINQVDTHNLVMNGNFEYFYRCPGKPQQLDHTPFWNRHTFFKRFHHGTTDFYHSCNRSDMGVPDNEFGHQPAYSGDGYTGMRLYSDVFYDEQFCEYLQGQLRKPLKAGATYYVSARVNCSDSSEWAINGLGIALLKPEVLQVSSEEKAQYITKKKYVLDFIQPDLYGPDTPWCDKQNWFSISGEYTAQGGESIIVLGRFTPSGQLKHRHLPTSRDWGYYYFDDIQVTTPKAYAQWNKLKPGKTIILKNIHFKLDKATLLPRSYPELNRLAWLLRENPNMKVEIAGHTDSTGSKNYNQRLSEARAKTVVQYLVDQGISRNRLIPKGYGSSQPIASNQTSKGRAKNRRVAFQIRSR